ncbi:hypothetical protein CEXT_699011 [Caerostris extrusa]|uniref:Uncharacterized protein n=1 Tax=Caerostris extrusa TaxID=172846 RepID=A0AAV4VW47_CAEEX|nr:hypothetical protein CEXT_699011 [Caerostris extrusa]
MPSKEEKRNSNDISRRIRHKEGREKRIISGREITEAAEKKDREKKRKGRRKEKEKKRIPKEGLIILRKNGHSLPNLAEDIEMKGVRPMKMSLPGGRKGGQAQIALIRKRDHAGCEEKKERRKRKRKEKETEPKEGLIILPKEWLFLSNLAEDIEINGVRPVKEGEKCTSVFSVIK